MISKIEEKKLKKKNKIHNRAINERIKQDDKIRNAIEEKLDEEKTKALDKIFKENEKENINLNNRQFDKVEKAQIIKPKETGLINPANTAYELKSIQIRQIPKNKSRVEVKFSEKVYPHLAMREQFLKKLPDPKPKNEKNQKKDDHNYLFYKDKGDEFMNNGDLEAAVEAYTICLQLNPEYIKSLINRGLAHFRSLKFDESLKDTVSALEILTNQKKILQYRGKIYV